MRSAIAVRSQQSSDASSHTSSQLVMVYVFVKYCYRQCCCAHIKGHSNLLKNKSPEDRAPNSPYFFRLKTSGALWMIGCNCLRQSRATNSDSTRTPASRILEIILATVQNLIGSTVAVLGFTFWGQWGGHNCSWGARTYIATMNHP